VAEAPVAALGGDLAAADRHLYELAGGADAAGRDSAGLDYEPLQKAAEGAGHLPPGEAHEWVGTEDRRDVTATGRTGRRDKCRGIAF